MLAHVRAIKQANEARWLALKGVVAVGIGLLADGRTGIVVSVESADERIGKEIPALVQDVPVEIRVIGPVKAQEGY